MNRAIPLLLCMQVICARAFAQADDTKVKLEGFVYYQIGQLVTTSDPTGQTTGLHDKSFDQHVHFRLTANATVARHLQIIAGTEIGLATFAKGEGGGNSITSAFSLKEAQGIYSFGDDPKHSPIQIAIGFFPYKYNPQATNMGEYLFNYRTGAYAPYIINDFDNCKARLLGFKISSELFGSLKQDLLFTSEMAVGNNGNTPAGDYSLSYVAGYNVKKIFDVGAGICFSRLVPIDPSQTTPLANIVYDENDLPVIENGDTVRLTMKAIKLMARATFDPKPLLPEAMGSVFGKEDGNLYSETAILGVKNYNAYYNGSPYYNDITQRWPIMIGFNVPTFKLLDVLSFETEYFGWPYNLSILIGTPVPNTTQDDFSNDQKFRWSIFSQRTITKGLCIKGLIGKDHFRTISAGGSVTNAEILRGNGNWHYNLRLMYQF